MSPSGINSSVTPKPSGSSGLWRLPQTHPEVRLYADLNPIKWTVKITDPRALWDSGVLFCVLIAFVPLSCP